MPRLYPTIRPGARYYASLRLLEQVKRLDPSIFTKSGVMLGLGEERLEIHQVMDDMRSAGIDFLTMGQYLQPTPRHAKVAEFVTPQAFNAYAAIARAKGFLLVAAVAADALQLSCRRRFRAAAGCTQREAGPRDRAFARLTCRAMPRPGCCPMHRSRCSISSRMSRAMPSSCRGWWPCGCGPRRRGRRSADLVVGFRALRERFTSKVTKSRPGSIHVDYLDGPLNYLRNEWTFRPAEQGDTAVDFVVDFAFRSRLFEALAGQMFDAALRRMIGALRGARRRALRVRRGKEQPERHQRRLMPHGRAAEISKLMEIGDHVVRIGPRRARANTTVPTASCPIRRRGPPRR